MKYRFKLFQGTVWKKILGRVTKIQSKAFLVLLLTNFFSSFALLNTENKSCVKLRYSFHLLLPHIVNYPKRPYFKLAACIDGYLNRFLS